MKHNRTDAIISLRPLATWTSADGVITWNDSKYTQPTEDEINAEITRLDNQYTADEYKRKRASAYPSLADQLDMQYWDKKNGTTTWVDAVAKVKSDNPKP